MKLLAVNIAPAPEKHTCYILVSAEGLTHEVTLRSITPMMRNTVVQYHSHRNIDTEGLSMWMSSMALIGKVKLFVCSVKLIAEAQIMIDCCSPLS